MIQRVPLRRTVQVAARGLIALIALPALTGATAQTTPDPNNPTCPAKPGWGPREIMELTPRTVDGKRVLLAEGRIDESLPERLKEALDEDETIVEVWFRSQGGNARAGNEAGRIIRSYRGVNTRIPQGWTCFSACNFVFMGGTARYVDDGGVFMVHMFTHTNDRWKIDDAVIDGSEATTELIANIEQSSALLASEDNDFLIRMGVSRKLLTDVMYRQQAISSDEDPSTRYCLDAEEVREYNVVNTGSPRG